MNAHSTQWRSLDTQGRIDAIRQAWFPGCSTAKIAAQLEGVTRNAIIGMYHRFPNSLIDKPLVSRGPIGNIAERKKRRAPVTFLFADKTSKPLKAAPVVAEEAILCGKPLMMLKAQECRWSVNEACGGDDLHLFCGLPAEGSYCGHHRMRAHQPANHG